MTDLVARSQELAAQAATDPHGRAADLIAHDGELRQTLIALVSGTHLGEHNSPPAATMQVLSGLVQVVGGHHVEPIRAGELWVLTHERHSVEALEDSVFLLTTVTSISTHAHG